MFLKYIFKYLEGRKKNRILLELLNYHTKYRIRYPNLVSPTYDYIGTVCSVFGMYEKDELECIKNLLKKYCKNKYIIDCGANIGNHTLFFSEFAKGVYSFEPNFLSFNCLKLNTFEKKNIKIFNYGLWSKNTKKKLYVMDGNLGATSIFKKKNTKSNISNFKKLDSFKELLNKNISLIKIDVEDAEFELINGAKKLLKKNPLILFEVSDYEINDKFYNLLKKKYDYKFLYVLKKDDYSKHNIILSTLKKFINSIKKRSTDNNFFIDNAKSVSERSGNSHFAIISKKKLILN